MNDQKLKRFNKIFPWYSGLSADLLFWIAIDTLFLQVVKHFNASQIVFLTTISLVGCIILQVPLLKIIKMIGNTNSVRLSSFLLLLASLLITFGQSFVIIAMGKVIYEVSFTFNNMSNAVLKNNLELQNKNSEFINIKTKGNTIYAVVTMIISFIASLMFNWNNYLPMYCCIAFCVICFILSFFIIDYSDYNTINIESKLNSKKKINYSKLILVLFISYAIFYPIINSGQTNAKLFIQQTLFSNFDVEKSALILGVILCLSRIFRVFSNFLFKFVYKKFNEKVGIILSILLFCSMLFLILGSFIGFSLILKYCIMSTGFILILFVRDPFKVYVQDLALKNVGKEKQQTLLTTMELFRKIAHAILSFSFSLILIDNSILIVIIILLVLSFIEIFVSIYLYNIIKTETISNVKNDTIESNEIIINNSAKIVEK